MTELAPCPSCGGLSQPAHPAGPLGGWRHTGTCPLLAHEDGRAVTDAELLRANGSVRRVATTTERTLLTALGYIWTTEPLDTMVTQVTRSVRARRWPQAAKAD